MTQICTITTRDIERHLVYRTMKGGGAFAIPHFTPNGWAECDVWKVSKAGYSTEYEAKVSLADYRAEGDKRVWLSPVRSASKMQLLGDGSTFGPNYFYYVCPEGLIERVPPWAGLIYAISRPGIRVPYNVQLREIKRAPKLHNAKSDPARLLQAFKAGYYRYIELFKHQKT